MMVVEGSDRLRDGAKVEIPERGSGAAPVDGGAKKGGGRRRKEGV
jgi:hypothetical protein